jgi:hypothetical protein
VIVPCLTYSQRFHHENGNSMNWFSIAVNIVSNFCKKLSVIFGIKVAIIVKPASEAVHKNSPLINDIQNFELIPKIS